jgi:hypothetical protein
LIGRAVTTDYLRGFSLTARLVDSACNAVAIGKNSGRWLADETPKFVALIKGDGRVVLGVDNQRLPVPRAPRVRRRS